MFKIKKKICQALQKRAIKEVKDSYTVVNKHVDNGKLKGYHYGAGGITYTSTLTW